MPAERNKRTPAASTAAPAAAAAAAAPKRGKAPSAMAKTVADSVIALPPKTIQALLKKELLPLVDASLNAEQKEAVSAAFRAALGTQVKDTGFSRLINYEGRKKDLEKKLKAFETDVRKNWKHGYEDQDEMLRGMCALIQQWCKDIFKVIVEEKAEKELPDAHRSLICMKGVAQKLRESNTRSEFETADWCEEYTVLASNGQVRYQEEYMSVLLFKLWRDILLTAIDIGGKSNEKFVKQSIPAIVRTKKPPKYGYRGGTDINLWHILRPEGDTSVEGKVAVGTRNEQIKWDDGWHSEGLKAALPRLRDTMSELVPDANRGDSSE